MRLTLPLGGLAAAALTVAMSGCGSSSIDPIAQAANATLASDGTTLTMNARMSGAGLPGTLTMKGRGAINLRDEQGSFALTVAGANKVEPMQEHLSGQTVYVSSPALVGKLPGGKRYLEIDYGQITQGLLGLNVSSLTSGESNPADILRFLKAGGGGVSNDGTAPIGGVPTTHYHGEVEYSALVSQVPHAQQAQARAAVSKLESVEGVDGFPVDVWIDHRHLVRQLTMNLDVKPGGQPVAMRLTMDMTYGPVAFGTAPPASESYNATSQVLSAAQSGASG
ncbi:MAG TPA: hypothetical protein VHX88_17265 [Solirubrobacteraceae bacterium]|jgi:hypothetical protein|nr:hypothetical protein [Solirubrobacteraceae bacterium]